MLQLETSLFLWLKNYCFSVMHPDHCYCSGDIYLLVESYVSAATGPIMAKFNKTSDCHQKNLGMSFKNKQNVGDLWEKHGIHGNNGWTTEFYSRVLSGSQGRTGSPTRSLWTEVLERSARAFPPALAQK